MGTWQDQRGDRGGAGGASRTPQHRTYVRHAHLHAHTHYTAQGYTDKDSTFMREFLETIIRQRFPFPDNHQKALITHGVHIVVCGGVAQVSSASHVVYVVNTQLDVVYLRLVQPVLGSPVFAGGNRRRS